MEINCWASVTAPLGSDKHLLEALCKGYLSQKELEAVRAGNTILEKRHLFNLNADLHFRTGTFMALYKGRGVHIDACHLLGLPIEEKSTLGGPPWLTH